ncbi:MAG: efflux RND transporter permease subunit [Rectinemataceae bacterium]
MRRFWEAMLKNSGWVVLAFVIVTVVMVAGARRIVKDTSAEAMNPDHNPIVALNDSINKDFNVGRNEIFVLHADSVFTPKHLTEIRAITAGLEAVHGVKKVTSLSNASRLVESDGVLSSGDLVPADNPGEEEIAGIRRYLDTNYLFKSGFLAAQDGTSTNIVVEFEDSADLPIIMADMVRPVDANWTGTYDLTGIPSLESYLLDAVKIDLPFLGGLAIFVILFMFAVNYRSFLGVWLPLLQILVGLVWGAGSFGWIGMKFQSLTIIAPIAILAVGSSFTLHLLGRYFLELSRGTEKQKAILEVMNHTALGVFVSGLAITASMLTFLLSDLGMVRGLGLFSALGVCAAMISSLTLFPALLHLLPAPKVHVKLEEGGGLGKLLRGLGHWIAARPKAILGTGAALLLVASFGIFLIVPNTALIGFFRPDSSVILGMKAVDKAFGGSTSARMLVDGDLRDPELLKALLAYQEDVRSIPGVGTSTSIATLMRALHETLSGEAGMPQTQNLVAQELLVYESSGSVDDLTSLVNLDFTQGIVTFITPRLSTGETKALFAKLRQRADAIIGDRAKVQFAGDVLTETAIEAVIIRDFIISLTLALALVILIDSLIRSLRAALVTIIVLTSTIVLQYGVMGLAGLPFNLATALAGALAIGVGDYAIHLTVRYMEDRKSGLSPEDAIATALSTSGRSVAFTAMTIGGGFTALIFSRIMPVSTLGAVMVLTVVLVGAATLTLLPAACVLFLRNPQKTKGGQRS